MNYLSTKMMDPSIETMISTGIFVITFIGILVFFAGVKLSISYLLLKKRKRFKWVYIRDYSKPINDSGNRDEIIQY